MTESVTVSGYTLVPGDIIIGSMHNVHHDKDYWKDPHIFCIDRFIDDNGELLKHKGCFHPFGLG